MKIGILGVGAIGGYYGARLAQSGEDVTFIARGDTLAALESDGIHVESTAGDFSIPQVKTISVANSPGPFDLLLIGLKAWQVRESIELIKTMISSKSTVLPLQNGIEVPYLLSDALGEDIAIGGICRISTQKNSPNAIKHGSPMSEILVGEFNRGHSDRINNVKSLLSNPIGMSAEVADDIHATMWNKFAFISSWGGIGAISNLSLAEILRSAECRELLVESLQEIVALAHARNVELPEDTIQSLVSMGEKLPDGVRASMQRDLADGKPSELEDQIGVIVRMGKELGVPTPVNSTVYRALIATEQNSRLQ